MKNHRYPLIAIILSIILSICITACGSSKETKSLLPVKNLLLSVENIGKSPQDTFIKAWTTVRDEYIDKSYNNQDWSKWKTKYIDKIKTRDDAYVAIETMLESLDDPYTRFLKPSDFEEQDRSIESKLYGIGIHIAQSKTGTVIIHVIENTPAQKAGLKPGDLILKINKVSTKGLDLKDVADMVRGKAGTHVVLTISRHKKQMVKDILRKKIDIKSVEYKILDNKYAYIKISSFISSDTSREMAAALKKTKDAKGIIVDLRGNYGGLLPNAIVIANMFINKGNIVSIVDRDGFEERINAEPFDIYSNKPVVVLINNASASASEILSGALKDHKRAILVGEKTFGKGLVQKIVSLPDGSGINITIAKYLTPNGTDINKKGIKPDYAVKYTEQDFLNHKDPQLQKAKFVLASKIRKNNNIAKIK